MKVTDTRDGKLFPFDSLKPGTPIMICGDLAIKTANDGAIVLCDGNPVSVDPRTLVRVVDAEVIIK